MEDLTVTSSANDLLNVPRLGARIFTAAGAPVASDETSLLS